MARWPRCGAEECTHRVRTDGGHEAGVSRRGLLAYGGASFAATWAAAGAGWYALIREPTGPEEDVVREYVDALDRSHFYTAAQLFHEDAPGEAWTAAELPAMDRVELTVEETAVVDRVEDPDIAGVEALALVHVDIRMVDDTGRETLLELAFVVAKSEDGEWKLWEDR